MKLNQVSSNKNQSWCRTCFLFPESQEHIFLCNDIRQNMKVTELRGLKYEMIYGDIEKQEKFVQYCWDL